MTAAKGRAKFAADTKVPVDQSRAELEKTLDRYGADAFAYSTDRGKVRIAFRMNGRYFRFGLTLPVKDDPAFTQYLRGSVLYEREPGPAREMWEQACRQKWRALNLVVKAKLEAVDSGISTLDEEFMANLVLPNGETMSEVYSPQIAEAYTRGAMPSSLLLEGPRG